MNTTTEQTTSIGITLWASGQGIEQVWSRGEGDARLIGWERADGQRAIETNGQPVFDGEDGFEAAWSGTPPVQVPAEPAAPRIAWRVYRDSDGRCVEFCGEFETREKALAHAETTPPGTPESDWESERKAGGQAALLAPSLDGKEDEEPLGWFGDGGWHVVVRVVYPAV